MAKYNVSMDVTLSVTMYDIEAENEEQAKLRAKNIIADDYMFYIKENGYVVDTDVSEVNVQEEDYDFFYEKIAMI